jgi:hypothetical protein
MNVTNLCGLINTEMDLNEKPTVKFDLARRIGSKRSCILPAALC